MALAAGTRLGPYEILAPLGAGGMGEVYRARDSRLDRHVAIKVLPPTFAPDPGRLARFEQEAKATAALNHPNIVAVFDVGVEDGQPYVVSELLEGRTLRAALADGALPLGTAIDVAMQMARGMAAAHEKGIVHRDLKPDNVFLTTDGRTKILDFGLAKLREGSGVAPGVSQASTALPSTMPGAVLGTVGYMSPEQVRGEPADHRSDIFAFGAVCYELLTGRRAFARETAAETMTAILKDDLPERPEDATVPPALDRVVRRCVEKNPPQRFQSASDIAFAIEALSGASGIRAPVSSVPGPRRWPRVALGVSGGVLAGIAVGFLAARLPDAPPADAVTFEVKTLDGLPVTNARFMPDGRTIVYSAAVGGANPALFVISPNAEAPQALGVPNAHLLSASSKGELALIVGARLLANRLHTGTLARMTLGSSPRPVSQDVREADWSPDGESLAIIHDLGNGRDRLEYPAGEVLHEASGYLSDPRVSPEGNRVAFFEHQSRFDDRGWVKVVDRAGVVTTLAGEFWGLEGLAWVPDGSAVIFSGNPVGGYAMQPMSVTATGGEAARTVFGVPGRFIVHDIAQDGRWLAVREDLSFGVRASVPGDSTERELAWLSSSGVTGMSEDGEWLLLVDVGVGGGENYGVVLRKTDGSEAIRLGEGYSQTLSPDGRWASAIVANPPQLVVYPTGAGKAIRLDAGTIERYQSAEWFPDSERMLVCGAERSRPPRCFEQDLAGSPARPVTAEGVLARLAPDGTGLLLALPDGSFELSSVDGGDARPVEGLRGEDRVVAWSRDGRAVFVQRGGEVPATIERVELATGRRTGVRQLAPDGVSTVGSIAVNGWVDDGRWYAYNYTRNPSTLFVVSGAQTTR